jgi:hypothetical protein
LEENGKVVIYSSDTEFNLEEMADIDHYIDHYRDADVLIFDTQSITLPSGITRP